MDSLAKDSSLDTYRFHGGLHGVKYKCNMEEVYLTQALKLKPGELSPVFPLNKVFSFIRLEKTEAADTAELPNVRESIIEALKAQRLAADWKSFIQKLRARFPVTVDSAALAKVRGDSAKILTQDFVKGRAEAVFRVDDKHKTTDVEFRTIISKAVMSASNNPFDSIVTLSAARVCDELVLSAAVDEAKYLDDPRVVSTYAKCLDSALVEAYLKETILPQIKFNRPEFETYYNQNLDQFREPEQFLLDRMKISDSSALPEINRRLGEGADFSYIGKQFGAVVNLANADDKNEWTSLPTFPESVLSEIRKLKTGVSTPSFPTSEGWVIFRLKGRRLGKLKALSDVESQIKAVLFQQKFDKTLDKILGAIKDNSTIEYKEKAISNYFGKE
jgi:hypothetical protein